MNYFRTIEKRLARLVSTDTSLTSANELPLANYLMDELKTTHIKATVFEPEKNRGNFYAQIDGNRPEKVVVHTHLDTERELKGSPCELVQKGNLYFGRGTLDCKGLIAVWTQVIMDLYQQFGKPEFTIAFAAVADEENEGRFGTDWLMNHTACFDNTFLAICEGGGYAVPAKDKIYFTIQTGEIEKPIRGREELIPEKVIEAAMQRGFYNQNTLDYFMDVANFKNSRSVVRESFYEGIWNYIKERRATKVIEKYMPVFGKTLKEFNKGYEILPIISPGYSDNRYFRKKGIDTIGFFPLHPDNYLGGIHGKYECITANSIKFSYHYCKKLLGRIAYNN